MKPLYLTFGALTAALALTACGEKSETAAEAPAAPAPAAMPAAPGADSMAAMKMDDAGPAKMAKGTGIVTAVDAADGTITVNHAPIPEANWPAMTMGFKAAPALVHSVKAGDKVAFDLKLENGSGEITALQKQ